MFKKIRRKTSRGHYTICSYVAFFVQEIQKERKRGVHAFTYRNIWVNKKNEKINIELNCTCALFFLYLLFASATV